MFIVACASDKIPSRFFQEFNTHEKLKFKCSKIYIEQIKTKALENHQKTSNLCEKAREQEKAQSHTIRKTIMKEN